MCVTAVTTSPGQHWVPLYTADSPPLTCDVTIWFPTTFSARHGLGPGSKPTIDIVTGNNPLKGRATRLLHTADSHPTLVRQTERQRIISRQQVTTSTRGKMAVIGRNQCSSAEETWHDVTAGCRDGLGETA